jgi:F-type H+-transporting ATPase subunit a
MDPIHQFVVQPFVPIHLFGLDVSFTNASLFMVLVVGLVSIVMLIGTSQHAMVPGRLQSAAEMSYEFVASTVKMTNGNDGMKFFPLIFTLFMFVLACNLLGLLPFSFSVTSQLVLNFALAIMVILIVIGVGVYRHGPNWFLKVFIPAGVSPFLWIILIPIEVISFLIRPVSLSVRLFANMLAGHITLKVMAGFVVALLGAGFAAAIAWVPFVANVVLLAFELFVAVLQAYIFTILTCVYLNDAIHPGH